MAKRTPIKILPTMKIDASDENSLPFEECTVKIIAVKDIETRKYGPKVKAVVEDEQGRQFELFLNNYSIENLNGKYGDDDIEYIGKMVRLTKTKDKQFDNEMIVVVCD